MAMVDRRSVDENHAGAEQQPPVTNDAPVGSETPQTEDTMAMDEITAADSADLLSEQFAAQIQEANDRALRSQAELENFRKRARREMETERRYAALPLLDDLLSVVDNLQRAIEASMQNSNARGLRDGVKMVAEQLTAVLAKHHCEAIEALGQPFDPHLHEALGQMPSDDFPAGNVCQQMRVGYRLHDRVVRPSQVFISSGPADVGAENDPTEN
jgi:molecular chaperone GrpE